MLSKTKTAAFHGIEGVGVEVETFITNGIPIFNIVGLAGASVKESKERVRAALKNSGFNFPICRITSNLVPANLRKEGSHLDLPIAIGILLCTKAISSNIGEYAFIGELSLSGKITKVAGVLPLVLSLRELGIKDIIVPYENRIEASMVKDVRIYPSKTLKEVINHLNETAIIKPIDYISKSNSIEYNIDFNQVSGQEIPKRAIEIAAAGMHSVLMNGPVGAGKTMIASRVRTILPDLDYEESLEVTKIYSLAGLLKEESVITRRPYRSPHHSITEKSMTGGGIKPVPGEVTLANRGVLFIDEFPEFSSRVIESLRQPIEDGVINISRQGISVEFPSKFMLVATMNPCPCGNYGTQKACVCSSAQINRYQRKISGPVMDRIDLQVYVDRVEIDQIKNKGIPESSKEIRKRVIKAHNIQKIRLERYGIKYNSEMNTDLIKRYCVLNEDSEEILIGAYEAFNLSDRAYNKILKIARTIADLNGEEEISTESLTEAIQYRITNRG